MKLSHLFLMAVAAVGLTACGGSGNADAPAAENPAAPVEAEAPTPGERVDGVYTAEMFFEGEDGYKDNVTLTISGGQITEIIWNGVSESGEGKREASENGTYDAIPDWHEQAKLMEAKVIELQDPLLITMNDDGTAADVPGVTMYVADFIDMVDSALYDAQFGTEE